MLGATSIGRLVKPGDLNHHETLFAGRMAEWLIEACFVGATRLVGRSDGLICIRVHEITFRRPIRAGMVLDIRARVARVGRRSITVHAEARPDPDAADTCEPPRRVQPGHGDPAVTALVTFVTVDRDGTSREHGLTLPPEYIADNRDIYEQAVAAATDGGIAG